MSPTDACLPAACPRCRSKTIEKLGDSPVAGVWQVYSCTTCFYTWRSTEPDENTDPDKYPAAFRLQPDELPGLQVAPSIPPLLPSADSA